MVCVLPAREAVAAEEGEGGAGLVVAAGHALHLQLEVQLRRPPFCHVRQDRLAPERRRQEVVGLGALVLQQCVDGRALGDHVTSMLLLQRAQQGRLRSNRIGQNKHD